MTYLTLDDVNMVIQPNVMKLLIKNQPTTSYETMLNINEGDAIQTVKDKLITKYDLDFEFSNIIQTVQKTVGNNYFPGERFYLGNNILEQKEVYTALFPAPFFDSETQYNVDDQVFYDGSLYKCIVPSSYPAQQILFQQYEQSNIDLNPLTPDKDKYHFQFVEKTTYPNGVPPGAAIDIRDSPFFAREFNFQVKGNIGRRNPTIRRLVSTYLVFYFYQSINFHEFPNTVRHMYTHNEKLFDKITEGRATIQYLKLRQTKINFSNVTFISGNGGVIQYKE